jgi:hypothetical protein
VKSPWLPGVLAVLAGLLLQAPIAAAQGNPPIEAVFPDDGAVIPVNPHGIEVRYTCPEYIVSGEPPFAVYGSRRNSYGLHFATSPELGSDGRLLQSNLVDIAEDDPIQDNDIPAGQCRGFLREDAHHMTPGTYYWQAWRICLACPGGYEGTPVRSFRLTASGAGLSLALQLPRRAYGGIPFHVEARGSGVPSGAEVALQAKRGQGWRRVGSLSMLADLETARGTADGPVVLRRGTYQLRAAVTLGSETVASPVRRLRVTTAKRWPRGTAGAWRHRQGVLPLRFTVSRDGRTLRSGEFGVTLLCPQVPLPGQQGQFTTQLADAPVPRARIAPDGSFAWAGAIRGHAVYVHGRIRGRTGSGRVRLSLGTCSGGGSWKAMKAG